MLRVIIGLVFIVFGAQAFLRRSPQPSTGTAPAGRFAGMSGLLQGPLIGILMVILGIGFLASTSFVEISAERVGHLKRVAFLEKPSSVATLVSTMRQVLAEP